MKDTVYSEFVEKLRAESDIVRIISDYVTLKKKGGKYWGCCPFHSEKTPSFSVTPEKGFFYCFGCQTGGDVFKFVMKIANVNFPEAVKLVAAKMNVAVPQKAKSEAELAKERRLAKLYRANQLARDFFHSCLLNTNYGKPAREYLQARGMDNEGIVEFQLGFAPPTWDRLTADLVNRGIEVQTLLAAGLIGKRSSGGYYDRFRNRIMFPIYDVRGRVLGFGGRVMDDTQPKYLNSPETEIFNKRHLLFCLDRAYKAMRDSGRVIIVEGYMDAISAHRSGVPTVVASLGTAFSREQAKLVLRYASQVIFAYDSDAAGQKATTRGLAIAREMGAEIKVLMIPDGKDPDEFIRNHGGAAFAALADKAVSLLEYKVAAAFNSTDLSDLKGKISLVEKVVPALATTDSSVEANAFIAKIAQALAIDESSVRKEVNRYAWQIKKDKNVNNGKNINIMALTSKPETAADRAERYIISLMCEDQTIIPYIKSRLPIEEINSESCREIVNIIFNAYNRGEPADSHFLASELSEQAQNELSHIMVTEYKTADRIKIVDDCLRTIHITYLQMLYEKHRLLAAELERMGDRRFLQELAESQRIKNDIRKMHCS